VQHSELILEISKAANAHLNIDGVLEALSRGLCPEVGFDSLSVLVYKGDRLHLHAMHVRAHPRRPDENFHAYVNRIRALHGLPQHENPLVGMPREWSALSLLSQPGQYYLCEDLQASHRFKHEEVMMSFGIRAYIMFPLVKSGSVIGGIVMHNHQPRPKCEGEIRVLQDACDIISIAVANALAYEEIASLKEQLQNENRLLQDEIDHRWMFEEIVGSSVPLRRVLDSLARVAPTDSTVLITGETGTGKELIARAIHRRSPRASRAMVSVNCASLAPELVASEMFGHEKGAFTGALQRRIGRFESAHRGTIFLDEVGEISPEIQAGLLRVLQERSFERVGGTQTIETDARVIAATNRDLEEEVNCGRFRRDLYYRLNVFPVHAPPLRERIEDIPILADYFVGRFARRLGKRIDRISKDSLDALMHYSWPGNIRELQNVLERAVILSSGDTLQLHTLDGIFAPRTVAVPAGLPSPAIPLPAPHAAGNGNGNGTSGATTSEMNAADPRASENGRSERERVIEALRRCRGRVSGPRGAARLLGVPPSTLESRIRALGIDKYQFRYAS
jgi:formate hydrogenlyase transcriptional activator